MDKHQRVPAVCWLADLLHWKDYVQTLYSAGCLKPALSLSLCQGSSAHERGENHLHCIQQVVLNLLSLSLPLYFSVPGELIPRAEEKTTCICGRGAYERSNPEHSYPTTGLSLHSQYCSCWRSMAMIINVKMEKIIVVLRMPVKAIV